MAQGPLRRIVDEISYALIKGSGGGALSKKILCSFGVDVDAVAGGRGSCGGEDSSLDISRGLFAGEEGAPRLVKLFDKYGMKVTWFVPGHSAETFPDQMKLVVDAGHEIGLHGYSHENPAHMTHKKEEDVLDKSIELIEKLSGKYPKGYFPLNFSISSIDKL